MQKFLANASANWLHKLMSFIGILSPPKLLPTEGNEVKVEEHGDTIVVVKVKEININYYQEEQSNTLR